MPTQRLVLPVLALCLSLLLNITAPASSQQLDPGSSGTLYLLAFPDTTTNTFDARFPNRLADTLLLLIYSAVDNEATITGPSGYVNRTTLRRGVFKQIHLNNRENAASPIITDVAHRPQQSTFRVESRYPVIVYCSFVTKYGAEAWTPLPVASWGREYFVAANPGDMVADITPGSETLYSTRRKAAPAEVLVIAALDNTRIDFIPNRHSIWDDRTSLVSVTLNAGECFQLQSYVDTLSAHDTLPQVDIAGVRIVATRPIGVVSGNTRTRLDSSDRGLAGNSFKGPYFEWLSPVENLGREFLFLPTWDSRRRTGEPGELIENKRQGERVRIYGVSSDTTRITSWSDADSTVATVAYESVYEERHHVPMAHHYRTDNSTQAFMSSEATVVDGGSIGTVPRIGYRYSSYSGYMVEMVPREQWTSFAPYFAPVHPSQMEHFVNIVADTAHMFDIYKETGSRVVFNRGAIPGTGLVWGTMNVTPGLSHYFEGRNGARFYATAYGSRQGYELYRPGTTIRKDDLIVSADNNDDDISPAAPAQYEENVALSYGYAPAPRRLALVQPDSLLVDNVRGMCYSHFITVRTVGISRIGLRSMYLADSSVNSQLQHPSPNWQAELVGAGSAEISVVPMDRTRESHGTVVIQDRSGASQYVHYTIDPVNIVFSESPIVVFPDTKPAVPYDTTVVVVNRSPGTVSLYGAEIHPFNQGFMVLGASKPFPVTLDPGDSFSISIRFKVDTGGSVQTAEIWTFDFCDTFELALSGRTTTPVGGVVTESTSFIGYNLGAVGPTPVHKQSDIFFSLGEAGDVTLELCDVVGTATTIIDFGHREAGPQRVTWDASNLPSGYHVLRLRCNGWTGTTMVMVVR